MSQTSPPPGAPSGGTSPLPTFLAGLGLVLAIAGGILLLSAATRLGGALLLAAGATAYRAGRMLRVVRAVTGPSAEAVAVARAFCRPGPGVLGRAGLVLVAGVTIAAVAVTLVIGHARLAPYVIGLGALSLLDLVLGQWVDRRCRARLAGTGA